MSRIVILSKSRIPNDKRPVIDGISNIHFATFNLLQEDNLAMHWNYIPIKPTMAIRLLPLLGAMFFFAPANADKADPSRPYDWQIPQARVTTKGDLEWNPRPFKYAPGSEIRYIDFQDGNNANDGLTPETAWKHHPWDPNATGQAAQSSGAITYVFKRGVIYRGSLYANESGTPDQSIKLTKDPDWGDGEAAIYGSERFTEGWVQACEASAPQIPNPDHVWYRDIGESFFPRAVWQVDEKNNIRRIPLARSPNWEFSNVDDYKADWWEWPEVGTGTPPGSTIEMNRASDPKNLSGFNIKGATIWSEWIPVMGTPHGAVVEHHDPDTGTVYFTGFFDNTNRMEPNTRYFIENLPQLLDAPGEYYFDKNGPNGGRIYLRLHDDQNPNTTNVEVARHLSLIEMHGQSYIEISGLTMRFTNAYDKTVRPRMDPDVQRAVIRNFGSGNHIRIQNCLFEHVTQPIYLKAYGDGDFLDNIVISDNRIQFTEHSGITVKDGSYFWRSKPGLGQIGDVKILRNKLEDIGMRPERKYHGHALNVHFPETAHIAGNILKRTGGAGIFVFGGKGNTQQHAKPFNRILIHHNKVVDPLLLSNDWGGIETWQGGPTYVFNNISGNPGGYWHWRHLQTLDSGRRSEASARFGFAYYLDGSFKNYVFNNVAWGKSSEIDSPLLNTSAFQEIHGFQNAWFHNTVFRFAAGSRRQAPVAGRNLYLGNLWMDISIYYFRHDRVRQSEDDPNVEHVGETQDEYSYETLGYAHNLFHAKPRGFGVFESTGILYNNFEGFANALNRRKALTHQLGWETDISPVKDADAHDFRLVAGSPAIDRGVKVFVPWALSDVVGEWHFRENQQDPTRIFDEHWNMREFYVERSRYYQHPRYDLEIVGSTSGAFVSGILEDWNQGALVFDGNRYAKLSNNKLQKDISYTYGEKEYTFPSAKIPTVDMQENSFLIELVVKVEDGHKGGTILSKKEANGYKLSINKEGKLDFAIFYSGNAVCSRSSSVKVNSGKWHHIIVEVDRNKLHRDNRPINIYVDGEKANGNWDGIMPTKYIQLSNNSDFLLGGGPGNIGFRGKVDFLRIARGTLADAKTCIDELYTWQFDGPHLRDFLGNKPQGIRRDIGAFEFVSE